MTAAKTNAHRRASGGRNARRSTSTGTGTGTSTAHRARTAAHASRPRRATTSRLARTLTDHDEIRRWAEERGGKPTAVKNTSRGKRDVGMIRIDFPGYSGEGKLAPIEWDQWLQKFDESNLALIVQDKTAGGEISHFNKLVAREGAGSRRARARSSGRARGQSSRSHAARRTR